MDLRRKCPFAVRLAIVASWRLAAAWGGEKANRVSSVDGRDESILHRSLKEKRQRAFKRRRREERQAGKTRTLALHARSFEMSLLRMQRANSENRMTGEFPRPLPTCSWKSIQSSRELSSSPQATFCDTFAVVSSIFPSLNFLISSPHFALPCVVFTAVSATSSATATQHSWAMSLRLSSYSSLCVGLRSLAPRLCRLLSC